MPVKLRKLIDEFKENDRNELILNDQSIQDINDVPDIFALKRITKLTLAHNKLTNIPRQIAELCNLEQLNLSNNSIEELPDTLSTLSNLRVLKLCFNRISILPKDFGSFSHLEIVDLSYNNLNEKLLPNNFYQLKTLRALYLSYNSFEIFPKQICTLENLQIIAFRDNDLIEIPSEIENLKNLKELHIQSNKLRLLPPSIAKLDIFNNKSIFNLENNDWFELIENAIEVGLPHLQDVLLSDAYQKVYNTEIQNVAAEGQKKNDKNKKTPKK